MEGAPKLPFIYFVRKNFPKYQLTYRPLLETFIPKLCDEDASSYDEEIKEFEELREYALHCKTTDTGLALLKRYYCQLYIIEKKIPPLKQYKEDVQGLSWTAKLKNQKYLVDHSQEVRIVLFNIGAISTKLAAKRERASPEDTKYACLHLRCAMWCFEKLLTISKTKEGTGIGHPALFQFLSLVSTAQAHECIVEKSILDHKTPHVTAKILTRISTNYSEALKALEGPSELVLKYADKCADLYKSWISHVTMRTYLIPAQVWLFMGMQSEDEGNMGVRIFCFSEATKMLQTANSLHNLLAKSSIKNHLEFLNDYATAKLSNAKKENEFIYHMSVPTSQKEPIKGIQVVHGIAIDPTNPAIAGPDIFKRFLPLSVHAESSVYSEEKAKMLREVMKRVEETNKELDLKMAAFYIENGTEKNDIPDELIEACVGCDPDVPKDLIKEMNKISDIHHEVGSLISEIEELLVRLKSVEKIAKLSISSQDIGKEFEEYQESYKASEKSSEYLRNAISEMVKHLEKLSLPVDEFISMVPQADIPPTVEEAAALKELRQLFERVENMRKQRATLLEKFRKYLHEDDITSQLVMSMEKMDLTEVIKKGLAKHEGPNTPLELLDMNLRGQKNLLSAIEETYAKYGKRRKYIMDVERSRKEQCRAMIDSLTMVDDIRSKIRSGEEFYGPMRAKLNAMKAEINTALEKYEKTVQPAATMPGNVASNPGLKLKDFLQNTNEGAPGTPSTLLKYQSMTTNPSYGQTGTQPHLGSVYADPYEAQPPRKSILATYLETGIRPKPQDLTLRNPTASGMPHNKNGATPIYGGSSRVVPGPYPDGDSWAQINASSSQSVSQANQYFGTTDTVPVYSTASQTISQGNNGSGQGYNGSGQGYNGSGQGYNGSGQGYNGFGQGYIGSGQGYAGSGQGFTGSQLGYGSSGQGYAGSEQGNGSALPYLSSTPSAQYYTAQQTVASGSTSQSLPFYRNPQTTSFGYDVTLPTFSYSASPPYYSTSRTVSRYVTPTTTPYYSTAQSVPQSFLPPLPATAPLLPGSYYSATQTATQQSMPYYSSTQTTPHQAMPYYSSNHTLPHQSLPYYGNTQIMPHVPSYYGVPQMDPHYGIPTPSAVNFGALETSQPSTTMPSYGQVGPNFNYPQTNGTLRTPADDKAASQIDQSTPPNQKDQSLLTDMSSQSALPTDGKEAKGMGSRSTMPAGNNLVIDPFGNQMGTLMPDGRMRGGPSGMQPGMAPGPSSGNQRSATSFSDEPNFAETTFPYTSSLIKKSGYKGPPK